MNRWVAGARPRTLPAAIVPVAVGTACVSRNVIAWRAVAAMIVALAIQIGTNYANDYADGVRGTDRVRTGPVRLVGSGLASPTSVKRAAIAAFSVAALAGLALSIAVGPELILVGAASIAAGWLYTGGPKPYGYMGLGEVFVFVFFGLVATVGSSYVQFGAVQGIAVLASIPVGLLAVSLLVVNNLRDIPGDTASGKRTLAVHLGDQRTRLLYLSCVGLAFVGAMVVATQQFPALLALGAIPLAAPPAARVRRGAAGKDLIPVLGDTGRLQLVFGVLLAVGLVIHS